MRDNDIHVVIIEDDHFSAEVLGRLLANERIDYTIITEPRAIFPMLEQMPRIDVIFLDLEMPGKDGFELLEMFLGHPNLAHTRIIACSVHTDQLNNAKRLGFHGFLGKPLRQQLFSDQLFRILNDQSVWEVS